MKRVRNDFVVLKLTTALAVVFLVLSTTVWFVFQQPLLTDFSASGVLGYYSGYLAAGVIIWVVSWLWDNTPYQRRIPRLHLASAALLWVSTVVGAALSENLLTIYFLVLLETAALYLLLALVALRIWHAFIPTHSNRWFVAILWVGAAATLILTPSTLNQQLVEVGRYVEIHTGYGAYLLIGSAFALVLLSIVLLPLGRRRYQERPVHSVGPLIFATTAKPLDTNLIELTDRLIHSERRYALSRGQWVHYRNHIHDAQGIISTEPKSCANALTTLIEYALHKNQTRAISVQLFEDPRHPYLHCRIEYTVNAQTKSEFTTFAEHFTDLGGHLTVDRTGRETTLTVTFPLQW